ncbi:MAG: hypothetical protein Q8K31_02425 [Burkholderiaceae bacterium]|nr:hypothetical protein [Burkholderiaceae bacterium]MDP3136091.1 hypothetical protein [Burkholderiaceae bacterium]
MAASSASAPRFHPSDELIRAAETLFMAMALESTVRPVVEQYSRAILAKHQFQIDAQWREHGMEGAVLDPKRSYLLSNEDADTYHRECRAARDAARLKVSRPDNCPLLEAESDLLQAQNAFITQLSALPGLELFGKTEMLSLAQRAKVVDLGLRLVAPFVSNADTLLKRVMAAPLPNA